MTEYDLLDCLTGLAVLALVWGLAVLADWLVARYRKEKPE